MQQKKKESLLLGSLLRKIAPRIGARVLIEPEWGIVGRITFKNGRHSYWRYNTLDLNPTGSSDIAKDKDYANFFLKELGYPTVPGTQTFFSDDWARAIGKPTRTIDAAYRHAMKLGFPVFVKPNSGSQGGGVALVHTKREFYTAMRAIFARDRVALVQRPVTGRDYRVVVLDDEIISAYERIPLSVVGDGRSSILTLLRNKQRVFVKAGRDSRILLDDPRMKDKLKHQGLSFASIPARGTRVFLLDNANLSTGGDAVDVTAEVHPKFRRLAIQLTREMGLRLCGVDLIVDGDMREKPNQYWVLEINAAPGLDHYVKMGGTQKQIVERLYMRVLKHLEKDPRRLSTQDPLTRRKKSG